MQFTKRAFQYLAALTACASGVLALNPTGVLFPLYIYPGDNCAGWSAVTAGISAHPNVPFYIVVNPGSGPGAAGSQPDANYQACTALLRTTGASAGNVKILGYVATGYGSRAQSDVLTDINTYSNWTSTYKPDGIFFDETSEKADLLSTYQTYASQVHSVLGTSYIVLNPGQKPETDDYYSIADQIITFENYYSNFDLANVVTSTSTPGSQQSILIHTGPNPTNATVVSGLKAKGVASIYLTNYDNADAYENIPSDYTNFLNLVDA